MSKKGKEPTVLDQALAEKRVERRGAYYFHAGTNIGTKAKAVGYVADHYDEVFGEAPPEKKPEKKASKKVVEVRVVAQLYAPGFGFVHEGRTDVIKAGEARRLDADQVESLKKSFGEKDGRGRLFDEVFSVDPIKTA